MIILRVPGFRFQDITPGPWFQVQGYFVGLLVSGSRIILLVPGFRFQDITPGFLVANSRILLRVDGFRF